MLGGKPWRRSHCEIVGLTPPWVLPGLRAEHRRDDRTLPTLSAKTWCSSEKVVLGFGVYVRCVGVQVQRCFMLFRCAERFGVVAFRRCWEVSKFRRRFRSSRVRGFKGVGSWFWCQSGPFCHQVSSDPRRLVPFHVLCSCVSVSVSASFPVL